MSAPVGVHLGDSERNRARAAEPSGREGPNMIRTLGSGAARCDVALRAGDTPAPAWGNRNAQASEAECRSSTVRLWIALALLAGSLAAAVRHVMGHKHPVLIPLLLVPALFLGWQEWGFRADQARFSEVASRIADRNVSIECQRFSGALVDATSEAGYVAFSANGQPADVGRLERDTCNNLRDWLHSDKSTPTIEQVMAVHVLGHEAYHLAGIRDEAQTECEAMQRLDELAVWLGATPEQGRALAERYHAEVYPHMPSGYRSGDCVEGGTMDVAPEDPVWP